MVMTKGQGWLLISLAWLAFAKWDRGSWLVVPDLLCATFSALNYLWSES
jgi:hypothetical protein